MLPFLKRAKEAGVTAPVETVERKPDEPKEYGILDAIWDDLTQALEEKDKGRGVAALEALCSYLREDDASQDQNEGMTP